MKLRTHRIKVMHDSGFMKFEARQLSKVPFNVPYMKPMIRERLKEHTEFLATGKTEIAWVRFIWKRYRANGWKTAFDMLRATEHRYRDKHPEYESPWERKRSDIRDIKALEQGIRDYAVKYPKTRKAPLKIKYLDEGGAVVDEG